MFATLTIVTIWFLIFIFLHIVGFRCQRGDARWLVRSYITCCSATLLSLGALSLWRDSGAGLVLSLAVAALASACLFVLYVPAVYTVLTSVSVETLIVLRRSGEHMPQTSLYDRFASRGIMQQRLSVLVGAGYLIERACGFTLTARGRGLARAFAFLKNLWRLGPGG
jgi:hypothetical protein